MSIFIADGQIGDLWSLVGKVATVVAIAWGLIQIYYRVIHKEHKLKAEILIHDFYLPLGANYSTLRSKEAQLIFSEPIIALLGNTRYFIQIKIANTGTKEINDIQVRIPGDGVFEIGRNKDVRHYKDVIQVGALRGIHDESLSIWSDSLFFDGKKIAITHPAGTATLRYSLDEIRLPAVIYRNRYGIYGMIQGVVVSFITMLIVAVVAIVMNSIAIHANNTSHQTSEPVSQPANK